MHPHTHSTPTHVNVADHLEITRPWCVVCVFLRRLARALSLSLSFSLSLSLSLCACTSVFSGAHVCVCGGEGVGGRLVTSLLLLCVDALDAFIRRRRVNDCTHGSTHARRHTTLATTRQMPSSHHTFARNTHRWRCKRVRCQHTHTHAHVHAPSYTHAHHVRTSRRTPAAPHAA